ncbi:MFS transporter [Marinobacter guineae]|nr:MFS transporter [Marinobacter guineae]
MTTKTTTGASNNHGMIPIILAGGFVFLSHQLGGFFGVWLGGVFFDRFASYDQVWYLAIALGVFSAIAHLLVRERPAPREGLAYGG